MENEGLNCQDCCHHGVPLWCIKCSNKNMFELPMKKQCQVCPECKGYGKIRVEEPNEYGQIIFKYVTCLACQGTVPVKEIKGKCKHTDCIHYGEICCARESECDGEEFYNVMPDGEVVREKVKEVKPPEVLRDGIKAILSNLIANSDYLGYQENVEQAVTAIEELFEEEKKTSWRQGINGARIVKEGE